MPDPALPPALLTLLDTLRPANLAFMALHPGDPPRRQPKKPFRPKVMVNVMGFPTGGGGMRLKFRF